MSDTIQTKQCSHCKQFKPISEFYRRLDRVCGYDSWCKKCVSIDKKKYYLSKEGKAKHKRYQQSKEGKAAYKRWGQSKKGKVAQKRHPEKKKARSAVNYAVRTGKLPKPETLKCVYCGKQAQQCHHWHSYEPEHQLDVVPVCKSCDYQQHILNHCHN